MVLHDGAAAPLRTVRHHGLARIKHVTALRLNFSSLASSPLLCSLPGLPSLLNLLHDCSLASRLSSPFCRSSHKDHRRLLAIEEVLFLQLGLPLLMLPATGFILSFVRFVTCLNFIHTGQLHVSKPLVQNIEKLARLFFHVHTVKYWHTAWELVLCETFGLLWLFFGPGPGAQLLLFSTVFATKVAEWNGVIDDTYFV